MKVYIILYWYNIKTNWLWILSSVEKVIEFIGIYENPLRYMFHEHVIFVTA